MKGIILAGGTGSRLFPLTKVTNKHLLPVGHEPMIFYPVKKLTQAGVEEIVIVTESLKSPAYPCAFCLQVMAEFFSPKTRIKIANLKGIVAEHQFIDLLPHPFGPEQLKAAR